MAQLKIKHIISNVIDELERSKEIAKYVAEGNYDELEAYSGEEGDAHMLLTDIEAELERLSDLEDRIDYAMLMAAALGNSTFEALDSIYKAESETEFNKDVEVSLFVENTYKEIHEAVEKLRGCEEHSFNWYGIHNEYEYERFILDQKYDSNAIEPFVHAARLHYSNGKGKYCMVELQVPTYIMFQDGEKHTPWLVAYEVSSLNDSSTTNEIYKVQKNALCFKTAEAMMLTFARDNC